MRLTQTWQTLGLTLLVVVGWICPVRGDGLPEWLPFYALDVELDADRHLVTCRQRVTWTNPSEQPTQELVFNVYPAYQIPSERDLIVYAKTLELLRSSPSESLDRAGKHLELHGVWQEGRPLPYSWRSDIPTALVVALPQPVGPGQSVSVELAFTLRLPHKQGRWGWYNGVTSLANWYPILAYYDECGWKPTPFIAWHQPFYNEAGIYSVSLTLPKNQKVASTGRILRERDLGQQAKRLEIVAAGVRDFTIVCSDRFQEWSQQCGHVRVRVLAFPRYEWAARKMLQVACEAIPDYNHWFGAYPYDEFDIVQGQFPWNGNECSGLIMIDERVFAIPQFGEMYLEHLISHETLHQWWYNVVGTNGYCETFMDESVVAFYTARRLRAKFGKNAPWLRYKPGFQWLPQIYHDTYLLNGLYGTLGRGEETATVQPLPGFGNVVTLFSMTYDRGAKILGMIEERIGCEAFCDFMRLIYSKYQFRVLHVAQFQAELEAYTGRSWGEFFRNWLWGAGMADWAVEEVQVEPAQEAGHWRVSVLVRQRAEFTEPTTLGFQFQEDGPYVLRLPVVPGGDLRFVEPPGSAQTLPDGAVRLTVILPARPVQISVDPDQIQPDREPANNHWKPVIHWRIVPLYTNLNETDLTTMYDRWNVTLGPWLGTNGPYLGNRGYAGLRAGAYRTQQFRGGTYLAWRFDDRVAVVGTDALVDHWPLPYTQVGGQFDHSLTADTADRRVDRGRIFARYILNYTPSLYLDQVEFVELYGRIDNQFQRGVLPASDGIERYDDSAAAGVRYQRFYYVPYWDPEAGYHFYGSYEYGFPLLGGDDTFQRLEAQIAFVYGLPEWLGWLSQTRLAFRAYGGVSFPDNGEMFWLGGPSFVRGLDRGARQGSLVWIGSVEWRVPLWTGLDYDFCYRVGRLKDIWTVVFYDAGDMFVRGQSLGGVAHSVGVGLRFGVALFSFVERMTWRLDVAKVVNSDDPVQVWFGIQQAF
jgi:hypothetical protein